MERHVIIQSFTDYQDAELFFETTLFEWSSNGWMTAEGCSLTYVNHQWRAGLMFEKGEDEKASLRQDFN